MYKNIKRNDKSTKSWKRKLGELKNKLIKNGNTEAINWCLALSLEQLGSK